MAEASAATTRRLAIFLPSLNGGGAERAMLNLAQGLAERECAVDLVLAMAKGPYLIHVRPPIRLVDLEAARVLTSLPALTSYLKRERPDAMLSALDYANVVALWARRLAGTPRRAVVNEQNTLTRSARNSARWRQRMVPTLAKRFYPWADFVIGNSRGVADDLQELTGLPSGRIRLLYNPIVTPDVRERAKLPLEHAWFGPGRPPVVLAVGRLTRQKGFATLLRAFAQVRRARPARLMILGEGPDRAALEALRDELGLGADIALPGFVDNPYAYMSRSSLFVLSSLWEGLPTVLVEALYCGAPVVATDCPSGPREILADGQHGALVPTEDVPALAAAIEAALDGRTPRPSERSWHPYALETIVDQYAELLWGAS